MPEVPLVLAGHPFAVPLEAASQVPSRGALLLSSKEGLHARTPQREAETRDAETEVAYVGHPPCTPPTTPSVRLSTANDLHVQTPGLADFLNGGARQMGNVGEISTLRHAEAPRLRRGSCRARSTRSGGSWSASISRGSRTCACSRPSPSPGAWAAPSRSSTSWILHASDPASRPRTCSTGRSPARRRAPTSSGSSAMARRRRDTTSRSASSKATPPSASRPWRASSTPTSW